MTPIALMIVALCAGSILAAGPYQANHSFVIIAGWPQSGTSLVNHMVQHSPHISNMIEKCNVRKMFVFGALRIDAFTNIFNRC
jgi:hypothetical protein